jgi:hypothetical protein
LRSPFLLFPGNARKTASGGRVSHELQKALPFSLQGLQFCLGVEQTSSPTQRPTLPRRDCSHLAAKPSVRQSLTPLVFSLLVAPAADSLLPSSSCLLLYGNSWPAVPALSSWTSAGFAGWRGECQLSIA